MDIIERIRAAYPDLTKKQKSIADYLIANPEDICYITLAQLSQNTSACEVTLLRFCQKMGCASFLELKIEFPRNCPPAARPRRNRFFRRFSGKKSVP